MSKTCGYKTIAETLRTEIRSGVRQPGEALPPERALSQSLGVERATVRRALAVLAEEGWIATRPGVGSVVKGVPGASGAPVAFIVGIPGGRRCDQRPPLLSARCTARLQDCAAPTDCGACR